MPDTYTCGICGAAVADRKKHEQWHDPSISQPEMPPPLSKKDLDVEIQKAKEQGRHSDNSEEPGPEVEIEDG